MTAKRDPAQQIAALPLHWDAREKLRVLMVTSRETKRWVMPKGWLMDDRKPWNTAKIEALEEAGAVGVVTDEPIGVYHYTKRLGGGKTVQCRVTVYPMMVETLNRHWKERHERKRHWFSPKKAARLVDETELADLLTTLTDRLDKQPAIAEFRKAS